MIAISTSLL